MTVREVPLAEAAELLSLSTEALRQRLKRGKTLRGIKRDGEWRVLLDQSQPDDRPVTQPDTQPETSSHDPPQLDATNGNQSQPDATAGQHRDPTFHRELVDALQAHIADLQQRLDTSEQAEAELRRLLAIALQTHALPAGRGEERASQDANSGEADTSRRREVPSPWWARWAWWRR